MVPGEESGESDGAYPQALSSAAAAAAMTTFATAPGPPDMGAACSVLIVIPPSARMI